MSVSQNSSPAAVTARPRGAREAEADRHFAAGVAAERAGDTIEAIACYERALATGVRRGSALLNLAVCHKRLDHRDIAMALLDEAAVVAPDNPAVHNTRGNMLGMLGRPEEAIASYRRSLALRPDHPMTLGNMCLHLFEVDRTTEARALLERAVALGHTDVYAEHTLALACLKLGLLERGFDLYENRWALKEYVPGQRRLPSGPEARTVADLRGRTVLVTSEQGLGDSIHFARFAPMVAEAGAARVILCVPQMLVAVLSTLPAVTVVAHRGRFPAHDVHISLLSLPRLFGTSLATLPPRMPYLAADPALIARWRERIGTHGLKIGVVWQGNPEHKNDARRSFPLAAMAPLADVPGARLISLQKQHGLDQLHALPTGMAVETLADPFAFEDTAAIMHVLDLVVTCDSSPAHLAGALARPVWLALPQPAEWRWMSDPNTCAWYPSARLFRQSEPGDWADVFARMARTLKGQTSGPLTGV